MNLPHQCWQSKHPGPLTLAEETIEGTDYRLVTFPEGHDAVLEKRSLDALGNHRWDSSDSEIALAVLLRCAAVDLLAWKAKKSR